MKNSSNFPLGRQFEKIKEMEERIFKEGDYFSYKDCPIFSLREYFEMKENIRIEDFIDIEDYLSYKDSPDFLNISTFGEEEKR